MLFFCRFVTKVIAFVANFIGGSLDLALLLRCQRSEVNPIQIERKFRNTHEEGNGEGTETYNSRNW